MMIVWTLNLIVKKGKMKHTEDWDSLILSLVKKAGFIRRTDLFKQINKDRETKLTDITFNRHLESLINLGDLRKFKYPDYQKLGLFPKRKNSSYIVASRVAKDIEHYDEVFRLLKSNNPIERKNALIEIESMGGDRIILSPAQLNFLVGFLDKEEYSLCENIIRIIYNSIENNKIFPFDLKNFQFQLINFFKTFYKKGLTDNVHAMIIFMLGILENPFVLESLKKEARTYSDNGNALANKGYVSWALAKIIDDAKTDLLKFQNSLGDENLSRAIFRVRKDAQRNLNNYELLYPQFKKSLKSLEEFEDYDNKLKSKKTKATKTA